MQAKYMIQWLLLFLTIINGIYTFELFIKKSDDNQDIESLKSYTNRTYQIPLFQTRLITIRIHSDDLRHNEHELIGFKFQVQSSDIRVMDIRKEIQMTNTNQKKNILLEDLFICKFLFEIFD